MTRKAVYTGMYLEMAASQAVVHPDTTPMSPFGRKAASNALAAGTKNPGTRPGF
jgi:hypothetical protein